MSFKTNEEAEFDFAISQADQNIDRLIKERTKQDARIAELTAEVARSMQFIEGIGSDLLNRRVADWYPEGANNAASAMSEDMRLLGNACMDFDIARNALKEGL